MIRRKHAAVLAAMIICSQPLKMVPDGYLYCIVHAQARGPINATSRIMSRKRGDVTEFSYGYRSAPGVITETTWYAEETSGSFDDSSRYCKAMIDPATRKNIEVIFESRNADHALVKSHYGFSICPR